MTYAVGTQKNHLLEMVLLSTQNLFLNRCYDFTLKKFGYFDLSICLGISYKITLTGSATRSFFDD